jgi:hypothetical protein
MLKFLIKEEQLTKLVKKYLIKVGNVKKRRLEELKHSINMDTQVET